jgi:type III secretion protein V
VSDAMMEFLNRFARLASARSEVVGASLIILMVVMMVIPISPELIDVLVALNISAAILLAVSAILIESPLSFSSFPAILLVTTLFRLSLTISTTRQILLEADAGTIIQTFGEFVVGGNLAVGLTVFLIISIVNFLVITKGSERIAEVAARFSLDGMPGKQMSIDSDLRAGLITPAIAKKRRSDLEKESQLFGAMDGAIKFVKNDAIAGLVITAVNLLGGLAVGMLQKDMSFQHAISIYAILSIGDGLIGIIPSLLVSIAAGLIVSRVTKGEADGSNTASDMFRDLVRNHNALQISGIVCLLFGLIPGMPIGAFWSIAALFFFGWFVLSKADIIQPKSETPTQVDDLTTTLSSTQVQDLTTTETYPALQLRLPAQFEPTAAVQIDNLCKLARNTQVEHLGLLLPFFEVTRHQSDFLEIHVYGVPALTLDYSDKRLHLLESLEVIKGIGDLAFEPVKDSVTGRVYLLCEPIQKPRLDQLGLRYKTFETRLLEQLQVLLIRRIHQMFTLNEYQKHVTALGDQYSEQLKELERVLPNTKVVDVLRKLMHEAVSIRNFRGILNTLIEWGQRERDVDVITEQVRRVLFEQICHQHSRERRMNVFILSIEFEQLIRDSIRSQGNGNYLDIDSSSINQMVSMFEQQMNPYLHECPPPAVVCSMDIRNFVRQLIEDSLFCIPVLSHQEIASSFEISVLGKISFNEENLET